MDVSVQAEILQLLLSIRQQRNLTLLFISHNIGVVEYLSDQTVVMLKARCRARRNRPDLQSSSEPLHAEIAGGGAEIVDPVNRGRFAVFATGQPHSGVLLIAVSSS